MEGDAVDGPLDCLCRDEVEHEMKTKKSFATSDVSMEFTATGGK